MADQRAKLIRIASRQLPIRAFKEPEKLEELKALFMKVAEENKVRPIGGGLFTPFNPQKKKQSSNTEWTLFEGMTRIPETQAPNVRSCRAQVLDQ